MLTLLNFAHEIFRAIGIWTVPIGLIVARVVIHLVRRRKVGTAEFQAILNEYGFEVSSSLPKPGPRWQTLASRSAGPWPMELQEMLEDSMLPPKFPLYRLKAQLRVSTALIFTIKPMAPLEGRLRWMLGSVKVPTRDKAFDMHWSVDTNQDEYLAPELTPNVRELFLDLARPWGQNEITLRQRVVAITDGQWFWPLDRFGQAVRLVESLAAIAEKVPPNRSWQTMASAPLEGGH